MLEPAFNPAISWPEPDYVLAGTAQDVAGTWRKCCVVEGGTFRQHAAKERTENAETESNHLWADARVLVHGPAVECR
jgi:hypothetical protein